MRTIWALFGAREFVAWGLDPASGRLIRTHELSKGHMGGAVIHKELMPAPDGTKGVVDTTVVVQCNLSALDPTSTDAMTARRTFSRTLHPLDLRGARWGEPPQRTSSLSFSINGGEFVDADVHLPEALYPFLLLTGEGDCVTLESIEKSGADDYD